MTLRTRLVLVLLGVVAVGLIVSDVVIYASLRSFLDSRVDPQLQAASYPVTRALLLANGYPVQFPAPGGVGKGALPGTEVGGTAGHPPTNVEHRGVPAGGVPTADSLVPAGTFGELVGKDGRVVGHTRSFITLGGKAAPAPVLPQPLVVSTPRHPQVFTAASRGTVGVTYRAMAVRTGHGGLAAVVAVPLTDVSDTLGELRLIEILVSAGILVGLGLFTWWLVRRDLRPLEDMAATAGEIAEGDLSRRVSPAGGRTEVGRLGVALNTMLGKIEGAFAAQAASERRLRRFLADASHELRTPLTSIRGYAEIFDLGARDRPADLATSMRHIREEADRMHLLVDELLTLARLDQERPLEVRATNVVGLVERSVGAARVRDDRCMLELEAPAELLVRCDAARVRQVADNLISNALRYSPPGGTVQVRVEAAAGGMRLEVADHGPGVPAELSDRIFEPFFREDRSRARETGGAGLGLAIVAAIARAHGGAAGVVPNDGGGSRFWCVIPGAEPAPNASAPGALHRDWTGLAKGNDSGG